MDILPAVEGGEPEGQSETAGVSISFPFSSQPPLLCPPSSHALAATMAFCAGVRCLFWTLRLTTRPKSLASSPSWVVNVGSPPARYGRAQLHDLDSAIDRLPSLLSCVVRESLAFRATGTDAACTPACTKLVQAADSGHGGLTLVDKQMERSGVRRPVYEECDGGQYVIDADGAKVYGVWFLTPESTVIVNAAAPQWQCWKNPCNRTFCGVVLLRWNRRFIMGFRGRVAARPHVWFENSFGSAVWRSVLVSRMGEQRHVSFFPS